MSLPAVKEQRRLIVPDGTVEAIKWLALALMVGDHINTYLLDKSVPFLYNLGRIAMPLFGFVLAYNLARVGPDRPDVYRRVMSRLALYGTIASIPYTLVSLHGWWPLNILVTFLLATVVLYLFNRGSVPSVLGAILLFCVGGLFVDFLWVGIMVCVAAYYFCRRPNWMTLSFFTGAVALLYFLNDNWWCLGAIPIILLAPMKELRVPRMKQFFYIFYPAHLAVLWLLSGLFRS